MVASYNGKSIRVYDCNIIMNNVADEHAERDDFT